MTSDKDFLDEIIEERTANNPDFPQMVEEASAPYVEVDFEKNSLEYPLTELDQQVEDILGFWDKFREHLKEYVNELSTEQCNILIDYFRNDIHEGAHGFRCTMFDEIGDCIQGELGFRSILDRYEAYVKTNGPVSYYCPTCDGQCESEEEHDKNAVKLAEVRPKEHYKFDEMSRDELLVLIKSMTPVSK